MKIDDFRNKISMIRNNGKMITNYWPGAISKDIDLEFIENNNTLIVIVQEAYRKKAYFWTNNGTELSETLRLIPDGTVVEYIYKDENNIKNTLCEAGLTNYATYLRTTVTYKEYPHDVPCSKRIQLLRDLYDPSCAIRATRKDIKELFEININTFDKTCDEVFTLDDWEQIVEEKRCLIAKENNQIISYYVWKRDGKKLYSNISVNRGPANYLYCLERKVFDEAWEDGIRVFYHWVNLKNPRLKRLAKKSEIDAKEMVKVVSSEKYEYLYNDIFVK